MKKVLVLTSLAFSFLTYSQNFSWANHSGSSQEDGGNAVALDASGNLYSTGKFAGAVDFDPGAGTSILSSAGGADVYLTKMSSTGSFLWAKKIGGIGDDMGLSIALDGTGNIIISGLFSNTANFNTSGGSTPLTSYGMMDAFICKLDGSGNLIWAQQLGGNQDDVAAGVTVDMNNNVLSTGYFMGVADFDPGAAAFTFTSGANADIFVSKLSPSGSFIWAAQFKGSSGGNTGNAIKTDPSGNVYSTGTFFGSVDFDPGVTTFPLANSGNFTQSCFINKLDVNGNFVWVKSFGANTSGYQANGISLCLDASQNIYTTGFFSGVNVDFDPGAAVFPFTSSGFGIFVSKLDVTGNFVWAKKIGGSTGYNIGHAIDLDGSGNVLLGGTFAGTGDFDPGSNTYNFTAFGGNDGFVSKLDPSGNFLWASQVGGPGNDEVKGIALLNQDVYTTGFFSSISDFDPSPASFPLTSAGVADIFHLKLSPACLLPSTPSNTTPLANLTICSGEVTSLQASSNGAINWYNSPTSTASLFQGNNFITPSLTAGTYSYYAEAISCTVNPNRTAIVFTIVSLPNVTSSTSSSVICVGETVILQANGADTYTWLPGTYSQTLSVNPSTTTSYTVIGLSSASGCQNKSVLTQTVSECTGLHNSILANTIKTKVYPNPSNGNFIIEGDHAQSLIITNSLGKVITKVELNYSNGYKYSFEALLERGLYFLSTDSDNKMYSRIIITE